MTNFLDENGLEQVWGKVKDNFSNDINVTADSSVATIVLKSPTVDLKSVSINSVTTTTAGVMTAEDKVKLEQDSVAIDKTFIDNLR